MFDLLISGYQNHTGALGWFRLHQLYKEIAFKATYSMLGEICYHCCTLCLKILVAWLSCWNVDFFQFFCHSPTTIFVISAVLYMFSSSKSTEIKCSQTAGHFSSAMTDYIYLSVRAFRKRTAKPKTVVSTTGSEMGCLQSEGLPYNFGSPIIICPPLSLSFLKKQL